jgi:hypothetical protein
MEEALLHFIWRYQKFNTREIVTDDGQPVSIFHPGTPNTDAGPDFTQAKIKIGDITWSGNVEIHVNGKDWENHHHQKDPAYEQVVLHVVWKNNASVARMDGTKVPTIELQHIVDEHVLHNYKKLFEPGNDILCHQFIGEIRSITKTSMLEKALAERLEARARLIFREIALTGNDWEEISWRMLCRNFGFKTNAEPFNSLGKSLPLKIIKKEAGDLKQIEALMFGQAGFLEERIEDDYFTDLEKEYSFKKKKYALSRQVDKHQWKFLRLRPGNFPTVRIAQLSALIQQVPNLFSTLVNMGDPKLFIKKLEVIQASYWQHHYNFGKPFKSKIGGLGKASVENLIINTVTPLLFAYGMHKDSEELKEKALEFLTLLKPEKNSITRKWVALGIMSDSAFDSQALIELHNNYCLKKRCLQCTIGAEVINRDG